MHRLSNDQNRDECATWIDRYARWKIVLAFVCLFVERTWTREEKIRSERGCRSPWSCHGQASWLRTWHRYRFVSGLTWLDCRRIYSFVLSIAHHDLIYVHVLSKRTTKHECTSQRTFNVNAARSSPFASIVRRNVMCQIESRHVLSSTYLQLNDDHSLFDW
jgi:hypothetical protein